MMLEGKTAIITGGGAGIGAAIAARFVTEGAKVCIVGRRENILDKMIQILPAGTAVKCRGDVSEPSDIARIVDTALAFNGMVDVLVNNAGVGTGGSVTEVSVSEWRKTVEINLVGPFMLMREVIPHMIKNKGGSIVNISSIASLRSVPLDSAYCASKAGLNALTQQAALDYGADGIRCNVICPGFVFSDMSEKHFGQAARDLGTDLSTFMKKVFQNIPSHMPAAPDKIAGICAFLASDDSSYITGTVIPVDGGLAIMDPFPLCVKNAGVEISKKN